LKIKVDENVGSSGVKLLRERGHDVMTVRQQGLGGCSDNEIFDVCATEGRTFTTLDRDFGHVLRFPSGPVVSLSLSWVRQPRRAFFTNDCAIFLPSQPKER
jgi:predicted nuclease of predicted toxin-antitoxin system